MKFNGIYVILISKVKNAAGKMENPPANMGNGVVTGNDFLPCQRASMDSPSRKYLI